MLVSGFRHKILFFLFMVCAKFNLPRIMQFPSVFPVLIHILLAECRMTSEHWFCHHLQTCVAELCMFGIVFHIYSSQCNVTVPLSIYRHLWSSVEKSIHVNAESAFYPFM